MFGTSGKRRRLLRIEEAALASNFHGVVGGVQFDFRHPKLTPVSRWKCPPVLTSAPQDHPGFYVVGDLDSAEPTLAGVTLGSLARSGLEVALEKGLDVLFPGDRVVVSAVDLIEVKAAGDLALEFDRQAARLHLEVIRATGDKEPLSRFWMLPRGSMAIAFSDLETMSLLRERTHGLAELDASGIDEVVALLTDIGKLQHEVNEAVSMREEKLEKKGVVDNWLLFTTDPTFNIYRLVNLAALYGYRQGRLEAEVSMAPLARGKLAQAEQARTAGQGNRDPLRESFAAEHLAEYPSATVASATKAFMALYPHEDASSVRRSFKRHFPLNRKLV